MSEIQQLVEVLGATPGLVQRVAALEAEVEALRALPGEWTLFRTEQKLRDEHLRDYLQGWAGRMELDIRKVSKGHKTLLEGHDTLLEIMLRVEKKTGGAA